MTSKSKIYITSVCVISPLILLAVFVIYPLFNGIRENAENLKVVQKEIFSINNEINNIGAIKNQYQEYAPNLNKINQLFINAEIPIDFIRFLEELAMISNVSIGISLSPEKAGGSQQWQAFNFKLSAESSFSNFSRFLEKLENAPYLIEVKNLSIRYSGQGKDRTDNNEISADLTIKIFAK